MESAEFKDLWKNRIKAKFGNMNVFLPSLDDMIKMKQAAGRAKDREDLKIMQKLAWRKTGCETDYRSVDGEVFRAFMI